MKPRMALSPITRRLRRISALGGEQGEPTGRAVPTPRTLSRREFLRRAGMAAAGAAATPLLGALPVRAAPGSDARVVIIGAGAAGVRCAHRLATYGIGATVYEAADRIGGRTYSAAGVFADGHVAEHGGEFISTEHTATRSLARNLGLELELINGGALLDGEEVYRIDGQFYTFADASADWAVARKAFKDELQAAPWPQTHDSHTARGRELDSISVPDWFDPAHPLSNPVLAGFGPSSRFARLLQTTVVAEYGADAAAQPALNLLYLLAWNPRSSIAPLAGTDERFRIAGGNEQLVQRMAAALPAGSIEVGRALAAIGGQPGGPYTCTFADGAEAVADHLVLALPFRLLREVEIAPAIWEAFSPAKRLAISTMPIGTNAKLHLQVNRRAWADPIVIDGLEIQPNGVAYSDPDGFQVAWDGSVPHPGPAAILVDYLGGTKGTQLSGADPFGPAAPVDVDAFLAGIEPVFPGTTAAYDGTALQSSWVDDPWHRGAYSHWGIGQYTAFAGAEGTPEGRIHFCGEHTSVDYQGFIEGAVRSGERVATQIHHQV